MTSPTDQQATALRELLANRTAPEWDARVQKLDQAMVEGGPPPLTSQQYEMLLAPVIRLRLRRALMHALEDGAVSSPAAAQILGYVRQDIDGRFLEELLDSRHFPNLGSPDFAFLRDIKRRLREDLVQLKAAAHRA